MKKYSEAEITNDALHKQPLSLMSMKDELRKQAWFIDYLFNGRDSSDIKSKLIRPIPQEIGNLMLTIVRNKSGLNRWKPKYTLVIYIKNGKDLCEWRELLIGMKRSNNK